MKFIDNLYLLLSYTNSHGMETKYPNFKSIAIINVIGFVLIFFMTNILAKIIFALIFIGVDCCFKETRGITISLAPMIIWVLLFTSAKDISLSWQRPIDVNTLYNVEVELGSVSFIFSKNENVFFDLLAWIPYGIIHYIMPILVGVYLALFYKPGYCGVYLFFFGIMNTNAVLTQLLWPTSPPWYYKKNGTNPADYTMHGDPAGLQRIDKLFHVDFYTSTFTSNPLPWGAWPSLHSGFAAYSAIFLTYLYPKYCPFYFIYVGWIWWATMYLGHHYLFDLLGGLLYAVICSLAGIIYLMIKKPQHKDYDELKAIMVQEDNIDLSVVKINKQLKINLKFK